MLKKVLLILVIIMGMIVVCAAVGLIAYNYMGPSGGVSQLVMGASRFSSETTEEFDYQTGGTASLDVETPFGSITVNGSSDSQIHISAHKTTWGSSQAAAEQALKDLKVNITQDQDRFTIRVDQPNSASRIHLNDTDSVDFTIEVPEQTTVVAQSRSGHVSLTGTRGKAVLTTDFGVVSATDIQGGLAIQSRSGNVSARQVQVLPTGNGDVNLSSDFGSVTLEDISVEHVIAHSGSGEISLSNVISKNEVDLSDNYGAITYNTGQASSLKVNTRSGAINLTDVKVSGPVSANSDFGSVKFIHVLGGGYTLSSGNGALSIDQASGQVTATTTFGSIDISNGSACTLNLKTSNGSIHYRGSLGSGDSSLQSDFGDISLALPQSSSFSFDLKTDFGKIRSDFKVTIDGAPNQDHWVGSVGSGGPKINAVTKNGGISLESYAQ